jgi:transcription antitermination factor NusG
MGANRLSQVETIFEAQLQREDLVEMERAINGDATSSGIRLNAGDRVRVACGVFMGVEGRIVERCAAGRLVVALDLVQSGVCLEIADAFLAPAD